MSRLDPVTHEDPAYARGWNDALEFIRKVPGTHKPGDHHEYRIECSICGQRGQVQLSVEPQRAAVCAWCGHGIHISECGDGTAGFPPCPCPTSAALPGDGALDV